MRLYVLFLIFLSIAACAAPKEQQSKMASSKYNSSTDSLRFTGEVHLRNIKQLTFGGNNAEAYWSFDDKQLIFQSDWGLINGQGCDQIYRMNADGTKLPNGKAYEEISTGKGRTTCAYYLEDGRMVFGSTHGAAKECPPPAMFAQGRYVWSIYDSYDIYVTDKDGKNPKVLIGGPGYDAEATASPDGRWIVFTSTRSGDLELWRYDLKTGETKQLTNDLGYDGGAFFSRDAKYIVWRASRPQAGEEAETYKSLLKQNQVEPKALDLYVSDIEGKNVRRVTRLAGANWAPFFTPDGKRIVFASNHHSMNRAGREAGREFAIFMVNVDGTGLQQITKSGTFDAFPMFSFSGKKIVFASNRNVGRTPTRDTNIFVADWVENPEPVDINFKGWK